MIAIPAIDVFDNKVVRLKKGRFEDMTVYPETPLQQAIAYQAAGFGRIHIIDLMGSQSGGCTIADLIKTIVAKTRLAVQVGGGIRTVQDISLLLEAGAAYFIIGSSAIQNLQEFAEMVKLVGPERIIIAADARDGFIAVNAWQTTSAVTLQQHVERCFAGYGITTYLCTDIAKDGMMAGPNTALYQQLQSAFPACQFIASGGVSCMQDIVTLDAAGLYAAVVGKAIYEGAIDLQELKQYGG